jgi:hypothetical protein
VGAQPSQSDRDVESLARVASLVPNSGEIFEVASDLIVRARGQQDRFDVGKVFVQRRTPDAARIQSSTVTVA